MEMPDQLQLPCTLWKVACLALSGPVQTGVLSHLPIHEGDLLSEDLLRQSVEAVKAFDPRLDVMVNRVPPREAYLKFPAPIRERLLRSGMPPEGHSVNFTIFDPAAIPQRVRLESRDVAAMLVRRVEPVHDGALSGAVQLSVVIGKDGGVLEVNPISGPETLVQRAVEAVRQWQYRPIRLNGIRREVVTVVAVEFP